MSEGRVVVGMSGGVDSTVAAAILKEKGYEVIGMTMALSTAASKCCSEADVTDARRMAQKLDIPHYVIPMHQPFQEHVVDYFVNEYVRGRTPNPCAVCNPTIKFGVLMDKARELGANRLATGHYAMISRDKSTGRFLLKRGTEHGKDQSYFLARLSQDALSRTLFPVGSFPKEKIRALAEKLGLDIARKQESQDVCFIPESGVADFIEKETGIPGKPGQIRDQDGQVLGTHPGIIGFTIGQRKGLGIAVGRPVYVTKIDSDTNSVIVGDGEDLYHRECFTTDPNWIGVADASGIDSAEVRIRYKHRAAKAKLEMMDPRTIRIRFDKPQRAITPGQLAVFYKKETVLGSAWITDVAN